MHDPVLKRSGFPNFFSSFKTAIINIKSVLYISLYFFQRFGYFSGQPPLFVNTINIIIFLICRQRFQQRGYYSGKQWVRYPHTEKFKIEEYKKALIIACQSRHARPPPSPFLQLPPPPLHICCTALAAAENQLILLYLIKESPFCTTT